MHPVKKQNPPKQLVYQALDCSLSEITMHIRRAKSHSWKQRSESLPSTKHFGMKPGVILTEGAMMLKKDAKIPCMVQL